MLAACRGEPTVIPELAVSPTSSSTDQTGERALGKLKCDANNGGITLPRGFCAVVVADNLGAARHMAITPSGDLFVAINQTPTIGAPPFGIVALRDANGDGKADIVQKFNANKGGSGIAWGGGRLFFGENDQVVSYDLPNGTLVPAGSPAVVVGGLPSTGDHISKTILLRGEHTLFVNIGSATNSCQVANRVAQSPGIFPCPELPVRAGVWTFNSLGTGQTEANGQQYAMGYRNMVALAVHPRSLELYGVQQGRDMLSSNWPQFFTNEESAVMPAEELVQIKRGSNNGWPYCFFDDVFRHRKLLAPEYGGDGQKVSGPNGIDCARFNQPLVGFGAHWSPDGMLFYGGKQFPQRYRGGVFVAFHGGFNRAPLPNQGFNVMFVPMSNDGHPIGAPEIFADGFAGSEGPLPANAKHRPVGVTEGPDGSLYISDDRGGRIWRVLFAGSRGD
jgi:glucose/arabinose dehydrogenase